MRWRKLGLVYASPGDQWWARSYATLPTAEVISDDVIRVYYAGIDENRYGRIGYVEVEAANPTRILYVTPEPVFDIGALGTFDDCGVNPGSVITVNGTKFLYYIGWQRLEKTPYQLMAGLAFSNDGGQSFVRHAPIPVLQRTAEEPYFRSAPAVIRDGETFKVWYPTCTAWTYRGDKLHYIMEIRHAISADGVRWESVAQPCIQVSGEDFAATRPWVIKEDNLYKMWYSIRSHATQHYRIGYAESPDGIHWERQDHRVGITVSESGWDSEIICYPSVVDAQGQRYLFYNGNQHGRTGFGCAVLESDE